MPSLGEALCIFRFFETQSERGRRRQGGGSIVVNKGDFCTISPITPLYFNQLEIVCVEIYLKGYPISPRFSAKKGRNQQVRASKIGLFGEKCTFCIKSCSKICIVQKKAVILHRLTKISRERPVNGSRVSDLFFVAGSEYAIGAE